MKKGILSRVFFIRYFTTRPRLGVSALAMLGVYLLLPGEWRVVTRLLAAWDTGLLLYIALVAELMFGADHTDIRSRAEAQDDGGLVILGLTVFTAIASLAAILMELGQAKALGTDLKLHVALASVTVVLSWVFMQTMFALHYAHEYYSDGGDKMKGGLDFPGHLTTPDYWDFVYFSFIIGTAVATADVNITSRLIRRTAALHCVVTFFFNTGILALTVNVGASLL